MKTKFRKAISILVTVLMVAASMPFTAIAATPVISLSIDEKTDFFAGMEYTVTATVTGVSAQDIVEDSKAVFTWSATTDDVSITSTNNYSYKEDGTEQNTYTVTETAKFILPDTVGLETGIKAEYGIIDGVTKTKSFTTLQPIKSVTINDITGTDMKYIESANKLYTEYNNETIHVDITSLPNVTDDAVVVTGTATSGVSVSNVNESGFDMLLEDCPLADFDININTASGVKRNSIGVIPCRKLTKFAMNIGGVTQSAVAMSGEIPTVVTSVVQSNSLAVKPVNKSPSNSNDEFEYSLSNKLTGEVVNDFTVDGEICTLNNTNPGTYVLNCKNKSKGSAQYGNGSSILDRDLEYNIEITVTKAVPIESISLFKIGEDGVITPEQLQTIPTLYTNTSSSNTYNLAKHLVIEPAKDYTDGYYYESGNKAVATVSDDGIITAVGSGEVQIRVISKSNPNIFASCDVKVVVGIKELTGIYAPQPTIIAGNSEQLSVITNPAVHDESIGWSIPEQYNDVLTVDQNGVITANEDYDFNGSTFVDVPVTATAQLDGKQAVIYIKVVPLDEVKSINVLVKNATGSIMTPEDSGAFRSYIGQTYTLSASAVKEGDEEANRILVWKVKVGENGTQEDITSFGTVKLNSDGSYTITPTSAQVTTSTKITYYCYATVNGTVIEGETPCKEVVINLLSPVTRILLYKVGTQTGYTSDNIPVGTSVDVQIETGPTGSVKEDNLIVFSTDTSVADVEFTEENIIKITGKKRGKAEITVTTQSATKVVKFTANVYDNIDFADVELSEYEYVFDGTAKTPQITKIEYNGEALSTSIYTVAYANNTNATENATLTISGKEEFTSSKKVITFRILPKEILEQDEEFTVSPTASSFVIKDAEAGALATYTIKDVKRNYTLRQNQDYVIEYENNKRAGEATAIIKGIGNYSGQLIKTFTAVDYATLFEIDPIDDITYTGTAITPEPVVKYYGDELEKDVDYTVSYSANVNAGVATITVKAASDYFTGQTTASFNIVAKELTDEYITVALNGNNTIPLDGNSAAATFTVVDTERKATLKQNTDYTIEYQNNDVAGEGTASIIGKGNYSGFVATNFIVKDQAQRFDVDIIPDQAYTGSAITPEPTVSYYGRTLEKDVDYSISYTSNINTGTATATIKGIGTYFTNQITTTFNIVPKIIESEASVSKVTVTPQSPKTYGFLYKDGKTVNYVGDEFTVSATAFDDEDKTVDADYTWYFSCDSGEYALMDNTPNKDIVMTIDGTTYFKYRYNPNNLTYTVYADSSLSDQYDFNFKCEAKDANENTASDVQTVTLVPKSALKFTAKTSTTIPTQGTVTALATFDNFLGYNFDEVTFKTSNPAIATVVKDENFDVNHTVYIVANQDRETMKTGAVTISAIRRDGTAAKLTVNVKNNIADATYEGIGDSYSYTGGKIVDRPILTFNGLNLVEGSDYTIDSIDGVNAGIATITISGKGLFAGTKVIQTTITQKNMDSADITVKPNKDTFVLTDTVRAATVECTVYDGTRKTNLKKDVDYTLSYTNNTRAGTAYVTVTGIGNYIGSKTATFTVVDQASKFTVAAIASQTYNGLQKTPKPVVKYNGKTLTLNTDYTLEYKDNIKIGTAKVYIKGIGKYYTGTIEKTFKINPKTVTGLKASTKTSSSITLAWTADNTVSGYQIYNVESKKIVKTISGNATKSYKISSLSAQKAYTYKVRAYCDVKGIRYYGAYSASCYTNTLPKTPSVTLSTKSKTITASWKKNTAVSGYQYQISLKSNFSGASTVKLSNTASSKKASGLKKGKKYYVRVRAYKTITVNGKKVTAYSAWSNKSIVCK
ncbi:MAG: fibronectin type III domain-containing protein [Eubacterium sp.]